MKIIVCVKQVPGTNNVTVDPVTGLLARPKIGNKLNPYDLFALEAALSLDAEADVITMGPPQATEVLRECIWMGARQGFLISDRAFGGADVLATSYTIASGIKVAGDYDLIITGKQTIDGDTAQVGAELAEHLGIPHVANVSEILSLDKESITVKAYLDNLIVTERLLLPCLICTDSDINTPRLPSYRRKKEGNEEIRTITLQDMEDSNPLHYGLKGSPTQVEKIFPPEKNTSREMHTEGNLPQELFELLKKKKFI